MIYKFKTKDANIGFDFDVVFQKEQKINCIIGKNGIGKTQLLENMAMVNPKCRISITTNGHFKFTKETGIYSALCNTRPGRGLFHSHPHPHYGKGASYI